ncbi:bifunctional ornithine acetyltransferase/N-acetylglutamate synthase, partial [Bifidobacterium pseudocatenulatum]|nr:bifunctional ornithine acetyltransferase/N-acetylglutamate synthase [Bifidobacterium pseudocatenulatum]
LIQKALSEIVKVTYNCLSVDGDQSTNDTLTVMANGLAGNTLIDTENEAYEKFKKALYIVMECMTMMLASDGEGATK